MITPQDIQSIEFTKGMRGYKEEEVDEFLDQLTLDYEAVLAQVDDLTAQLNAANAKLEEYKGTEGAVIQTLEAAKALMNDIAASAEKRAEILVKNAELDAELKARQAEEAVERLKEEEKDLTARVSTLRSKFRSMLEAELERFDNLSADIFGKLEPSKEDEKVKTADFLSEAPAEEKKADPDEDMFKTITNFRSV